MHVQDIDRPAFAASGASGTPVCEITVGDGNPVAVPLTREENGAYVSCLVVPVSELDAEADLGLEGNCNAVKISLDDSPYAGSQWQKVTIDIKGLVNGNTKDIVSLPTQTDFCALFSALVAADDPANTRASLGVVNAGEKARTLLDCAATAFLSPDIQTLNDLLSRHSMWVHSGHGGYVEGITVVKKVGDNKYEKGYFKASDISRNDLAYNLVFMNTCESTDNKYVPYPNSTEQFCPGWFGPYAYTNGTAVLDIGNKLNAKNYVGWDCEVKRQFSVGIPKMLMQELDSTGTGQTRTVADAVNAVRNKLRNETPMKRAYWWYEARLNAFRTDDTIFDLNKKPF